MNPSLPGTIRVNFTLGNASTKESIPLRLPCTDSELAHALVDLHLLSGYEADCIAFMLSEECADGLDFNDLDIGSHYIEGTTIHGLPEHSGRIPAKTDILKLREYIDEINSYCAEDLLAFRALCALGINNESAAALSIKVRYTIHCNQSMSDVARDYVEQGSNGVKDLKPYIDYDLLAGDLKARGNYVPIDGHIIELRI